MSRGRQGGRAGGEALREIWRTLDQDPTELAAADQRGGDPVLPSIYRVATAASACVAAALLAAAGLWRDRGGPPPSVSVSSREAAVAFRSERYLRVNGVALRLWDPLSGDYQAGDGGWVRLHSNFPHHRGAVLSALRLGEPDRSAVASAVAARTATEVEDAVERHGGCAARMRTRRQWAAHPQAAALRHLPLVSATRLTGGRGRRLGPPDRPLAGVRVLDLTRVIAGPVAGRALAACGADVLHVGAPHLPDNPELRLDTDAGKRSAHLDLRSADGRAALLELVKGADVLVQSYRPGALDRLGLGPGDLAGTNPALVCVSISAYGAVGPWHARRGFDSLVQMTTGIAAEHARASGSSRPVPLPAQVLDHATGWLAAAAAVATLRHRDGGARHLQVSLARTAMWLDRLGRVPGGLGAPDPGERDVADLVGETDSHAGRLTRVRAPGRINGEPLEWRGPPPRPGSAAPTW